MDKKQYFLESLYEDYGEDLANLGLNLLENPELCVKVLLEQMRSGNDEFKFVLRDLLLHGYGFHLLQAEDKQWLLDADCVECKAIVLKGMYRSWHTWEESFTDEDTGETVVITRKEILRTPLFPGAEDEAKVLFEQICQQSTPAESEELVHCVRWHTPFDYTLIIRNEYEELLERSRKGEGFYDMKTIHQWGHYGWTCEELGNLYFYGEEKFGYYIDIEKAKFFYAEAQKAKDYHKDESLLVNGNPTDGYDKTDYEDSPETYRYSLSGPKEELAKVKDLIDQLTEKYGMPDNELGLYIPKPIILNRLVGIDASAPKYRGNLLFMDEEENGALTLVVEANEAEAFAYALEQKYPAIEAELL